MKSILFNQEYNFKKANEYFEEKEFKLALKYLLKCHKTSINLSKIAYCYTRLEKFQKAIKTYLIAIEIDDKKEIRHCVAFNNISDCYLEIFKLNKNIEMYQNALRYMNIAYSKSDNEETENEYANEINKLLKFEY